MEGKFSGSDRMLGGKGSDYMQAADEKTAGTHARGSCSAPCLGARGRGAHHPRLPEEGRRYLPGPPPLPSGRAKLVGFDGANPNCAWQLWVVDDYSIGDSGHIDAGWSITIKAKVLR